MNYNEFKEAVVKAAKQANLSEYELYYEQADDVSVETYKKEIKSFNSTHSGGICFRCIMNGKMGYSATEALDEEEAVNLVERAIDNAVSIESEDEVFLYGAGDTYQAAAKLPETTATDVLIEKAVDLSKAMYEADARVIDGTESGADAGRTTVSIYNSKGLDLSNTVAYELLYGAAIMSEGEESVLGMEIEVGNLADLDAKKLALKAVEEASNQIHNSKVSSGKKNLVFSGKMMATMLQTFQSVFSADNAQKGLSLLAGKEGTMIASKQFTLVDDPFYKGSTIQMPFDAEGVATHTKDVITEGKLNTLLYNLKTAKKAGVTSTANASKLSYKSNVEIKPFTCYVKPGELSKEDVFAKAKEGIYITEIQGMHAGADPTTGDFSLAASGYAIKDGKKGECVKGFTIAGNFFDLLKQVDTVGADLEFGMPRGFTRFGAPSVLVTDISVAGQ